MPPISLTQKGDHMQIDCCGFEASSQWFRRKELEVYLMKEVEGVVAETLMQNGREYGIICATV